MDYDRSEARTRSARGPLQLRAGKPTGVERARVVAARHVVLVLCFLLALGASPAQAHTDLQSSTPASGARLDAPPAELQLRFTEDISTDFAQLALTRGETPVQRLQAKVRGPVITAGVPPASVTGNVPVTWEVSYRVVSADGHPITGTVEFTAPAGAPSPSPTTQGPSEAPGADTDEAAGDVESATDDPAAGAAAGADQRDADDSGLSPNIVTMAAIAALALAVTAAAMILSARRRSEGPR